MLSPSLFSLSLYATKAIILGYLTISTKIIKTEKQTYLQKGNIKLLVWWSGRSYYGSPKDLKKEIIHLQQSLRLIVVYIIELGKSNKPWLHKVNTINIFSNQCANYNNYWLLLFSTINNTISKCQIHIDNVRAMNNKCYYYSTPLLIQPFTQYVNAFFPWWVVDCNSFYFAGKPQTMISPPFSLQSANNIRP